VKRAFIDILNYAYQVDMAASTTSALLGFNAGTLHKGYNEGDNPVDIN
jgi:hypothetical protein